MPNASASVSLFLHAGRVAPDPKWRMPSHAHAFHELICPLRGQLWVRDGTNTLACGVGDLLLYPAGVKHEEWTEPGTPIESVFVSFTSAKISGPEVVRAADPQGRVAELLQWLHRDAMAGVPGSDRVADALLGAALAELDRGPLEPEDAWVQRVRNHLQRHLADTVRLDDLARVAGLSRYHFVRAFQRAVGRTPMAELRRLRVQHAKQLILGSALPLKEIAVRSGLGNEYALSRTFRNCLGVPPGKLRRSAASHRSKPVVQAPRPNA